MSAWMLSYLFYVGIVLPTVVTLALFVFFVICWRKQSARKAVLTKPYDPHGTMRRLGIPNRPPPPPVFLPPPHHNALLCPRLRGGEAGGEDNAAYDMSRSPSAEVQAVGGGGGGGVSLSPMGRPLPPTTLLSHHTGVVPGGEEEIREQLTQRLQATSPCDLSARLALHQHLHHRLDSGLSEPACHSPVAGGGSSGGGESGDRGEGASGGGGGGGGSRERPQSQNSHTSHSSHSTDSEDSGFRSSRSGGQLAHTSAASQGCTPEPPGLKRSRSAGRGQGQGRGQDPRGAGSSSWPESDGDPPIQLTPTALWPHHLPLHHHHHHPPQSSSNPQQPSQSSSQDGAGVKTTGVDPADIRAQLDWRYLQHLAFPGHPTKGRATTPGGCGGDTHRSPVPCQRLTLAHVHSPGERDNPEVLGFSVV